MIIGCVVFARVWIPEEIFFPRFFRRVAVDLPGGAASRGLDAEPLQPRRPRRRGRLLVPLPRRALVAPIEALAAGAPLVVSDAAGAEETAGDAGIVVPTGDVNALADALGSLLDDPERRRDLAAGARRRAEEHYSLASVGAALRVFLQSRPG